MTRRCVRWTKSEDFKLWACYEKASPKKLQATFPDRPYNSICVRAKHLGIPRRVRSRTDGKVANQPLLKALRRYRLKCGIQAGALAKKMGYHPGAINDWESGRHPPRFSALLDWCDALGVCLMPWPLNEPRVSAAVSQWAAAWDRDDPEERRP